MKISYSIIEKDLFLRKLKQSMDIEHVILLGAGASKSSGIPTATECMWDWKYEIYTSNVTGNHSDLDLSDEKTKQKIQHWLDTESTGKYPKKDANNEYMFYAEENFISADLRRKYFEELFKNKEPSIGYKLLSVFAEQGIFKIIMTTNFDGLVPKVLASNNVSCQEIAIETAKFIHKPMSRNKTYYIALHGDYKYEELKNTNSELDSQEDDFVFALKHHLHNKDFVVLGYSGRDSSLMNAISQAYGDKRGGGAIYWCAHGKVLPEVENLLTKIKENGRDAYLVKMGDFDEDIKSMARHCFSDIEQLSSKINTIIDAFDGGEPVKIVNSPNKDVYLDEYKKDSLDALASAMLFGGWKESKKDSEVIRRFFDGL